MNLTSITGTRTAPEQRQISDGGDAPVVALLHRRKHGNQAKWLWGMLIFFIVFAGASAGIDIAVMKGLMTAKFSDEFGLVADDKHIWIWLTSFVTVLYFFAIGRLYYAGWIGKKLVAVGLYVILLCFLAINIHSSYMSDFLQIFGASSSGWKASVLGVAESASLITKSIFMLIVSVVMTGPGLMFAWAERRVELTFMNLMQNSMERDETQGMVDAYQAVKNQTDADADQEKQREERYDFFSDDANKDAVGKASKAVFHETYLATLQTRLAAVPKNTLQMSRAEQAANDAKRKEISSLLAKAQSLSIH